MPDEEKQEDKPVEVTSEPTAEPKVVETPEEPKTPETTTPAAVVAPTHSSAGSLVLQWLTYAFWGWLILALIWLVTIVLVNAILDEPVTGMVPYAIAASLVLLPLAFFTDRFYAKQEPVKKIGGEAVIMVIHAVLFAILGIIALIVTVFTALSFTINITGASESDSQLVALLITGFTTLLYAAAFLRTLNPFQNKKPVRIFRLSMLGLTILLLVLALVGPLAKGFATRNDRLIEQNLSYVESSISSYIQDNEKLPDSLNDVKPTSEEAEQLIKDNLVTYKKDPAVTKENLLKTSTTTEHRYQLCVVYAEASKNSDRYPMSYQINKKEYATYLSTSNHGKGEVCYKLQTTTTKDKDSDLKVEVLNL